MHSKDYIRLFFSTKTFNISFTITDNFIREQTKDSSRFYKNGIVLSLEKIKIFIIKFRNKILISEIPESFCRPQEGKGKEAHESTYFGQDYIGYFSLIILCLIAGTHTKK